MGPRRWNSSPEPSPPSLVKNVLGFRRVAFLEDPDTRYPLLATATEKPFEHANHCRIPPNPQIDDRCRCVFQVTSLTHSVGVGSVRWNRQIPCVGSWKTLKAEGGKPCLHAGATALPSYKSARVIRPILSAALTASPRFVALSLRKILCRWVSTEGGASPASLAKRFVV